MLWRWFFDGFLLLPAGGRAVETPHRVRGLERPGGARCSLTSATIRNIIIEIAGCVPAVNGTYDLDPPTDVAQLGDYADLKEVMTDRQIDLAIVADQNPTRGELRDLVTLCEKEMVHLQIIPSALPGADLRAAPGDDERRARAGHQPPAAGFAVGAAFQAWGGHSSARWSVCCSVRRSSRCSGCWFIWESPGPVFYRQRRGGVGGKLFDILKIRSMKLDAERLGKPGWSTKTDDRRLKVGAFMRRWNIDEVPQFLNVLLGQMSLVGPRPERPEFIASFKEEIPHYNARHGVKPGITGWAQVNGLRGDTDLTERIRCDLYYIENWSLALDCQIMLMTFFKQQNAC